MNENTHMILMDPQNEIHLTNDFEDSTTNSHSLNTPHYNNFSEMEMRAFFEVSFSHAGIHSFLNMHP